MMKDNIFIGIAVCIGVILFSVMFATATTVSAEEAVPAETQAQETAENTAPETAEANTSGTAPHDIATAENGAADYASAVAFYGDAAGNYTYDIEIPGAAVKEVHFGGKKMNVSTDSNLRVGPSTDTESKLVMGTGTTVNVIAYTDNDWSKVFYIQETPGEAGAEGETPEPVRTVITGYVKSTLLTPTA